MNTLKIILKSKTVLGLVMALIGILFYFLSIFYFDVYFISIGVVTLGISVLIIYVGYALIFLDRNKFGEFFADKLEITILFALIFIVFALILFGEFFADKLEITILFALIFIVFSVPFFTYHLQKKREEWLSYLPIISLFILLFLIILRIFLIILRIDFTIILIILFVSFLIPIISALNNVIQFEKKLYQQSQQPYPIQFYKHFNSFLKKVNSLLAEAKEYNLRTSEIKTTISKAKKEYSLGNYYNANQQLSLANQKLFEIIAKHKEEKLSQFNTVRNNFKKINSLLSIAQEYKLNIPGDIEDMISQSKEQYKLGNYYNANQQVEVAIQKLSDIIEKYREEKEKRKPKIIAPAESEIHGMVKCFICLGYIKPELPVITCKCGRTFHEVCRKRVAECPYCKEKW